MRLFAHASYPFIQWRRWGYIVTAVFLLGGIAAMVYNTVTIGSWVNYGVDFEGGSLVQVDFNRPTTVEEIRTVNADWQISRFGEGDEFVIRMAVFDQQAGSDAGDRVREALEARYGPDTFEVVRTEAVGPQVGAELQQRALLAILISFVLTTIYLAFRFEWRFGVAAIAATAHDIIFTLGIIALLRTEVSVGTVAALLTIVGYSLNDTIIIFDRVRETLQKPRHGSLVEVLNRGINETLPRTLLTSGTTLSVLFSLYLFGGAVIRDFALVLILGIAIGTFSSIFVAPPVLVAIWNRWRTEKKPAGRAKSSRDRARAAV